jgi:internalin A
MENELGLIADIITIIKFLAGPVIGGILGFLIPALHRKFQLGKKLSFPDKKLEVSIREILNADSETPIPDDKPLTKDSVKTLTELDAESKGITDLTGLRYVSGLRKLVLGGNNISDLGSIADLIHLEELYLWNNRNITDISPLKNLIALRYLNLNHCKIADVTPLTNLKQLIDLRLSENEIVDVSPLEGLSRLKVLEIGGNPIMDIIDNKINKLKPEQENSDIS